MKQLLLGAVVALAATTASAEQLPCGDFSLQIPTTKITCPSAGTISNFKSTTTVKSFAGQTLWSYSTDLLSSSGTNAVAAGILISNDGAVALSINGTQCPEAVDNSTDDGPGSTQNCHTEGASNSTNPRVLRILFNRL